MNGTVCVCAFFCAPQSQRESLFDWFLSCECSLDVPPKLFSWNFNVLHMHSSSEFPLSTHFAYQQNDVCVTDIALCFYEIHFSPMMLIVLKTVKKTLSTAIEQALWCCVSSFCPCTLSTHIVEYFLLPVWTVRIISSITALVIFFAIISFFRLVFFSWSEYICC